jgi:hypothetical protein
LSIFKALLYARNTIEHKKLADDNHAPTGVIHTWVQFMSAQQPDSCLTFFMDSRHRTDFFNAFISTQIALLPS